MQRTYSRSDTLLWAHANDMANMIAPTYGTGFDAEVSAAEPTLDLSLFRSLLKELGAHDAVSSPGGLPYHVAELSPEPAEALVPRFNELSVQLEALRRAGAKVFADKPGERMRYVAATVDDWKDAFDLSAVKDDPLSYTGISLQDLLYQVPEAYSDFRRIADFANIQMLVIFGNDLDHFPFDPRPLQKLRWASLGDNTFRALPEGLRECKALEGIDLVNNQLTGLPEWLTELPALRELNLKRNPLAAGVVDRLREMLPHVHITS